MDPASWVGGSDLDTMWCCYETLVGYKYGTWDPVNILAEEFTPNADGTRFDFKLKEGIPFHGGYGEMTADDVKFSFERLAGLTTPKIKSPYVADWEQLQQVKVTGTYTGTIILKQPFAPLLYSTIPWPSGMIVSKRAVEERGKKFPLSPIGTGPYEVVSVKPKSKIVMKRFEDYGGAISGFAPLPTWDEVEIIIVDASAKAIAIETGEADIGELESDQEIAVFTGKKGFTMTQAPSLAYYWLGMNVSHPSLQDQNIRLAIRYAIDVPAIIEGAYGKSMARQNALITESVGLGFWADAPAYERDLEKAKSYLKAGNGEGLEISLGANSALPSGKAATEIIQANLAEIGIKVKIELQDGAAFNEIGKELNAKKALWFDVWGGSHDPHWSTLWFTCKQMTEWNWLGWCNKEYTTLNVTGTRETDRDKRQEIYTKMQQLMDDDVVAVFVGNPVDTFVRRDGILMPAGADPSSGGTIPLFANQLVVKP